MEEQIQSQDYSELSQSEMNSVYQALSSPANDDIDTVDEMSFVQNIIETIFDKQFKLIESESLQKNHVLLNNKFVELIKHCQQSRYKKINYIFLTFCYYFDLDESVVYKNLHEKLQMLIRKSTIKMCGRKEFERAEQKHTEHPDIKIHSLFSLVGK